MTQAELFRASVRRADELIALLDEDERDASMCFQGALLADYRETVRRDKETLLEIRRLLERGC